VTAQQYKKKLPFPTSALLALDMFTVHCRNELPLTCTADPLEFPRKRTDTQPPPATAFLDRLLCADFMGTAPAALLCVIVQPVTVTLRTSNAAMEPPHVEHGWLDPDSFGHAIKPPNAVLRVKVLFWTLRNSPPLPPVADTAPPLAALQLTKTQCDTVTLLSTAETAPPLPFMLEQL
jgi:hypothetical protein